MLPMMSRHATAVAIIFHVVAPILVAMSTEYGQLDDATLDGQMRSCFDAYIAALRAEAEAKCDAEAKVKVELKGVNEKCKDSKTRICISCKSAIVNTAELQSEVCGKDTAQGSKRYLVRELADRVGPAVMEHKKSYGDAFNGKDLIDLLAQLQFPAKTFADEAIVLNDAVLGEIRSKFGACEGVRIPECKEKNDWWSSWPVMLGFKCLKTTLSESSITIAGYRTTPETYEDKKWVTVNVFPVDLAGIYSSISKSGIRLSKAVRFFGLMLCSKHLAGKAFQKSNGLMENLKSWKEKLTDELAAASKKVKL